MARVFAEEPDGCGVKSLRHKAKERQDVLPTLLIVCDRESEFFRGLQVGIKPGGVSTGCGQIHTGVREGTFRHGMSN